MCLPRFARACVYLCMSEYMCKHVCVVTGWGRGISREQGCYRGSAELFCTTFSVNSLLEGCRNPIVQVLFLISTQINWENGLSLLSSFPPSLPSLFSFSPNFSPFSIFFLLALCPQSGLRGHLPEQGAKGDPFLDFLSSLLRSSFLSLVNPENRARVSAEPVPTD